MHSRLTLLLVLTFGICFSSVVGCCIPEPVAPKPLTVARQTAVTAHVSQLCVHLLPDGSMSKDVYDASGVVISANRVLTAGHIADCKVQGLYVEMPDGSEGQAGLVWRDEARDIAMLSIPLSGLGKGYEVPALGPVSVNEVVCAHVAEPDVGTVCGIVTSVNGNANGNVVFTGPVEHGNSGAGVYDPQGRLVGIITKLMEDGGGMFVSVIPSDLTMH